MAVRRAALSNANRANAGRAVQVEASLKPIVLGLAVALALIAGWTDWRSRRIPNWLTVPGLLVGVSVNAADWRLGWG